MVSHQEIAAALRDPGFYPERPQRVEVHETHTSIVFVAGERAYKLKKPVSLGFLDYSTEEARRAMCREEVRLNRRLAPSVYLGVRSIVEAGRGLELGDEGDPRALEHVVEMRRYDEQLTLAALAVRGDGGLDEVRSVAAALERFHAGAPLCAAAGGADPRAPIKRSTDQTLASLLLLVRPELGAAVAAAERFSNAFLLAHRDELAARAAAGRVRDVHGDLRAEHVLLSEPIEVVDCVEFDPALRQIDVGYDLAFLAMDLERLDRPELARELVSAYRERGGDPGSEQLVGFFAAHRAWVRANVALLRAEQRAAAGEDPGGAVAEGEALLALGRRLAWRARGPLLLVLCGLSGSGKSHLARELAAASGIAVLASDRVRKELAGVGAEARAPAGAYSEDFNERTYDELGRRAAERLEEAGAAIVDATFRLPADRAAFAAALGAAASEARFVECIAPDAVRLERVAGRSDASDATVEIARGQEFAPLDEVPAHRHLPLRTDRSAGQAVAAIEAWLDSR